MDHIQADYHQVTDQDNGKHYLQYSKEEWISCESCFISTTPQRDIKWRHIRYGRITGTTSTDIIMNGQYKRIDPEQLALQLLGRIEPKQDFPSTASQKEIEDWQLNSKIRMNRGNIGEPLVRSWYSRYYDIEVKEIGFAIWKQSNYIGASVDGLIEYEGITGIIEIKCSEELSSILRYKVRISSDVQSNRISSDVQSNRISSDVQSNRISSDVQKRDYSHIPVKHYNQMQHGMKVTGASFCDYIVLGIRTGEIYIERIPFNQDYWDQIMFPKYVEFIRDYLEPVIQKYNIQLVPVNEDYILEV